MQARTVSKTGLGTAITQTTIAASNVSISIPAEKGGTLIAVEAESFGILETVVNTGGLVALHNSAEHWEPFEFWTGSQTTVTAGGLVATPTRILCHMALPSNSTVTVDFTPQDNQSQQLAVTLYWIRGAYTGGAQTFAKSGVSAALSATSRSVATTVQIPGGHSGTLKALQVINFGTVETVKNSGGKVEVENDAVDIIPCMFYTPLQTTVGAAGGGLFEQPMLVPKDDPAPENSTYLFYFTPYDDQSQIFGVSVIWEA